MESREIKFGRYSAVYIALESDQHKYETLKELFGFLNINQTIVLC